MLARVETSPRARWGWGPSDLASQEEKDAFRALRVGREIESGRATVADLPEEYGGRPQGSSRRAIRQRIAWDAEQAAAMQQQQEARQVEEFNKNMLISDLDYQTKSLTLELKRTELAADLQNQKIIKEQAVTAREIFGKYPDTPEGIAAASDEINKIAPRAWEDETIGKIYFYKDKNSRANTAAVEAQQNKIVEDTVSAALREGLSEADIAKFKTLDQQNKETYDVVGLRREIDTVIGGRVVAAEKEKEPKDPRTELQKAQDELDEAKARLGAYVEDGEAVDEDSESYRRVLGDVNVAQARVDRLSGAKPKPKKEEDKAPQYTPEQITAAKDIARDIKHPKNKQAIRLLKSIGESY